MITCTSSRGAACNCQQEPAYPMHETVLVSFRFPDLVCHHVSGRCSIEEPHEITNCGEFTS